VQLNSKYTSSYNTFLEAANFVINELQKLSYSRVYDTLALHQIVSAETTDGVYHKNTKLVLNLSSPYFASGEGVERFRFIVMEHYKDGKKNIAMDRYPTMEQSTIERFWIRKAERLRRSRRNNHR